MHKTTPEIDYPYPVPSSPDPYLSHSPPRCRNSSDTDSTVRDGLRQSNFSHPTYPQRTTSQGGLAQTENNPQTESNELSEKQLAALPYMVSSPSVSETAFIEQLTTNIVIDHLTPGVAFWLTPPKPAPILRPDQLV